MEKQAPLGRKARGVVYLHINRNPPGKGEGIYLALETTQKSYLSIFQLSKSTAVAVTFVGEIKDRTERGEE